MKTALLYVALVCAPLLGLTGILYLGERLVPPPGVGGTWAFTPGEHEDYGMPCVQAPSEGLELVISQSGPRLDLRLNDAAQTRLAGTIRADSIRGRTLGRDRFGCDGDVLLHLEAELREEAGLLRLVGHLAAPGCACAPVAFVAVRQPET